MARFCTKRATIELSFCFRRTDTLKFNSTRIFFGKHEPKDINTNPFIVEYNPAGIRLRRRNADDSDQGIFIGADDIKMHKQGTTGIGPLNYRYPHYNDDVFGLRIEIKQGAQVSKKIRKLIRADGCGTPECMFDPFEPLSVLRFIHIHATGNWAEQAKQATNAAYKKFVNEDRTTLGLLLKKAGNRTQHKKNDSEVMKLWKERVMQNNSPSSNSSSTSTSSLSSSSASSSFSSSNVVDLTEDTPVSSSSSSSSSYTRIETLSKRLRELDPTMNVAQNYFVSSDNGTSYNWDVEGMQEDIALLALAAQAD